MQGKQEEKKHGFVFPKKEDLIDQIKAMEDDIENVSLNLVKCDFNAVEHDVEKTFPDYTFIKVKKYNPGSFEVILETRIDAINFIRNSFDKKILSRRFFIKMGRQQREHAQNWAAVGYVPKVFKQQPRRIIRNKDQKEGEHEQHTGDKEHEKREFKPHYQRGERQERTYQKEQKVEVEKKQDKVQTKPVTTKQSPVVETPKTVQQPVQQPVIGKQIVAKPVESQPEPNKPVDHKVIPKYEPKPRKARRPEEKNYQKKEEPKVEEKKIAKVQPEQTKEEEDDGWIVVPAKKGKGKK